MVGRIPTAPKVLTTAEVEQFVDRGYILLRDAFPRGAAAAVCDWVMPRLGVQKDGGGAWPASRVRIETQLSGPLADACITHRFTDAVDDLLGAGAWVPLEGLGGWPVLFPGFATGEWTAPLDGWHVDGIHFHHHLDSKVQGLLPIFLFTDIGPGDGGTAIRPGSHKVAARALAESEPAGLDVGTLAQGTNEHTYSEILEANGSAGDILLLHPFMSHATSTNNGDRVRIICNPCLSLKAPMNLSRANSDEYTPLERSIVAAITDGTH